MIALTAAAFVFLFAADATALSPANQPHKTETSGLGLSAGIGSEYPVIGAQAAFFIQMPHSLFRVTPYASLGGDLCNPAPEGDCTTGWAAGVIGSWGHQHRVLADVFLGTVGWYWFSFHGEEAHTHAAIGSGLAVGYEFMAFSGFFVRTDIGLTYAFGPPVTALKNRFAPALTLIGIGYKFW